MMVATAFPSPTQPVMVVVPCGPRPGQQYEIDKLTGLGLSRDLVDVVAVEAETDGRYAVSCLDATQQMQSFSKEAWVASNPVLQDASHGYSRDPNSIASRRG